MSSARFKIPHVFILLTAVIFFCSLLTYVIPSGEYQREKRQVGNLERTVVLPGTFQKKEKHISLKGVFLGDSQEGKVSPVSLTQFLSAIPRGMEKSGDIIFFIFIIGGVLGILQHTGAITAAIQKLMHIFRASANGLTIILMIAIGVGGSTLGMGEEFIPLIPLFLIISREMGYDRVYGLSIVLLAAVVGFAAATTNPFTVNIAQGIAELPLNSGVPFRAVFWIVSMTVTIIYLLRYGAKIKRNPSASVVADLPDREGDHQYDSVALTRTHLSILLSSAVIFVGILYAVESWGWWLSEMAGGFFLMGIVAVIAARLPLDEAAGAFVKGMEEMVVAALVVGFARGIEVVLSDGQIMDTLIHSAAVSLQHFPNFVAAQGMLLFQTMLNFLIPSGSGQAAVTMPLMAPLADVLGLSRQTAVFAFTCGDGFSNTIIPTSGVLMAMLSLANIPYQAWLKFMFPLFLQLMLLAAIFLSITVFFPGVF